QPDDRSREQRNADQVLAVGERQVLWIVDIGIEDRPRFMEKRVRVPPEDVPSDLAVWAGRKPEAGGMQRKRIGQQQRERREKEHGGPRLAAGPANPWWPDVRNHGADFSIADWRLILD